MSEQFCLRWNNHQSTLISVFETLLESGSLIDCTLCAEGQLLKAHKVVLSACSPIFESMLCIQEDKHPIIFLKDVKFIELKAMLDYMYKGEVNILQDQLDSFLRTAAALQIKGLTDQGGGGGDEPPAKKGPGRKTGMSDVAPESPLVGNAPLREGSVSPTRRRRRIPRRPSSAEDASADNSCDIPPPAVAPPAITPATGALPVSEPLHRSSLSATTVKAKQEPIDTPLVTPKQEFVEETNEEIEDLTLDDDDDYNDSMSDMSKPGTSFGAMNPGSTSQQDFSQWQQMMGAADRSGTDEVFMAAQEAINNQTNTQEMKNVGPLKSIFLGGEEYRRWYKSKHGVVTWRCKMYSNAPLRCNARLYTDSGFNILKERSFYIHNHGSEGKEKSPSPTTFSQDFLSLSQPSILDENEQNLRDVTHPEQTKPTDRDSMHSSNLDGNSSPSKCALGYGRNVKLRYRGYLFIKRYQLRNGLFRWSCVKSKCSASIYTDSALNLTKSFCRFTHTHKPPPRNDSGIEIQSPLQIADNRDNQGGGSYSSVVRRVSVVLKKVKVPYYFENNSESVEIGGEARQQIGKEDSLRYMTKITETPRRRGRGRGGYRGRGIRRRRGFQKGDCQRNTTDIAIKDVFSLPHELRQPLTTDESVPERALVRSTSAEIMHDRAIPSAHGLAETTQQEGDKPCLVALPLQIKRQKKLKRGRKPGVNYRKLAKCPGLPPQETVRRSPEDTVAPDSSAYFRHPGVLEDPLRTVPSEAFNLDELQHQEVVLVPSPEPTPEKTLTRRSRKSLIGKRRRKKGEGVAYLRWLRKNYREKPTRRSMRFSVKSEKIDFTYEQLQRIQCGEVIDIDSDNESTTVNQLNENSALKISNLTSEGGPSSSSSRVVLDDERICPSNITATQTVYEAPCVQVVQQSGLPGSSSDYQTDSNDQTVASAATHSVFYEPFVSVVHHTGESLNCQPSISDQMDAHNSNVTESYTSFAPILQPTGEFPTFGNTPVNCEHPYAHMCPPNEFSCTSAVHNSHSPVDFKDVMLLDTPLSPDSVIDTIVLSD